MKKANKRNIRVTNVNDARRLLQRVMNQLQDNTISIEMARCLTYVVKSYVEIFSVSKIEEQLDGKINEN